MSSQDHNPPNERNPKDHSPSAVSPCADLQQRLTLEGPKALASDETAQQHLTACNECFAVLEGLAKLDRSLRTLPGLEPPQAWLEQLLEQIPQTPFDELPQERWHEPSQRPHSKKRGVGAWGQSFGAWGQALGRVLAPLSNPSVRQRLAAILVVGLGSTFLLTSLFEPTEREWFSGLSNSETEKKTYVAHVIQQNRDENDVGSPSKESRESGERPFEGSVRRYDSKSPDSELRFRANSLDNRSGKADRGEKGAALDQDLGGSDLAEKLRVVPQPSETPTADIQFPPPPPPPARPAPPARVPVPSPAPDPEPPKPTDNNLPASPSPGRSLTNAERQGAERQGPEQQGPEQQGAFGNSEKQATKRNQGRDQVGKNEFLGKKKVIVTTEAPAKALPSSSARSESFSSLGDSSAFDDSESASKDKVVPEPVDVRRAHQFLASREQFEGLSFRDPTGYWRNTYVPGDPMLRLLAARLVESNQESFDGLGIGSLHGTAQRPVQPFDPPDGSALGLTLSSDHRAVSGESRVLLQVGLRATDRRAGQRPRLDLAVVFDLTEELSSDDEASFRALVHALASSKQPSDRFQLLVAGRPGGVLVPAEAFHFGPLQIALDRLFEGAGSTAPSFDLPQALSSAIEELDEADLPERILGSSAILLATPRTFGTSLATLETLAHQAAVASFPLSIVGIGEAVDEKELSRLAIAGQGNRRLLLGAAAAPQLVDRELAAVSRTVARAVRLSIRLAPGVRLIDVVGSENLDERAAQRVRDAEQSVDLKISRSLGITADRGDDEEGIQIVIPAFLAGDTHAILLDLVVPGPGSVADVRVRFKDLVRSRNGVTAARLQLARGKEPLAAASRTGSQGRGYPTSQGARGQLELNVLQNFLVLRMGDALENSGKAIAEGDHEVAREHLVEHLSLLRGLGELLPEFGNSPEVLADQALLDSYLEVLSTSEISSGISSKSMAETLSRLSDSLRYAARLKVLPAPERNEP